MRTIAYVQKERHITENIMKRAELLEGEQAEYVEALAERLVKDMQDLGADKFGILQAREVVAVMIVKGYFTPNKGHKYSNGLGQCGKL